MLGVQGALMDSASDTGSGTEFATSAVLTDLTLALLQDSGWCAPSNQHLEPVQHIVTEHSFRITDKIQSPCKGCFFPRQFEGRLGLW